MFTSIHFPALRNGEFMQFYKQLLAFVLESDPTKLQVLAQYEALRTEWAALENLFKKDIGSDLTEEIESTDLRRDNSIVGLRSLFHSYTYHYDTKKVDSAQLLLDSIDKYGSGIARKNYQEESAIVSGILKDWEADAAAKAALKKLGAVEWQAELQKANETFELLYRQRTADLVGMPDLSFSTLRAPVIGAYRILITHLTAHATLASDQQPYEQLVRLLNKHIDQYQNLINQRTKSKVEEVTL